MKQKNKIASIAMIVAITAGTITFALSQNTDKLSVASLTSSYPLLEESEKSTLTGFLYKRDVFHGMNRATEADMQLYTISSAEKTNFIDIQKGINYMYSDEKITYEDVFKSINPKNGDDFLEGAILIYDPKIALNNDNVNLGWIENPDSMYKGGRIAEKTEIIPRNVGIVFISSIDTKAFDLKDYSEKPGINIGSVCHMQKGWNMIATAEETVLELECSSRIKDIWTNVRQQKGETETSSVKEPFALSYAVAIGGEPQFDIEKFTSGYIHWVNLKDEPQN